METEPFYLNFDHSHFKSDPTTRATLVSAPHITRAVGCHKCNITFDSQQSLDVHLQYHTDRLVAKWASEVTTLLSDDEADDYNNNNIVDELSIRQPSPLSTLTATVVVSCGVRQPASGGVWCASGALTSHSPSPPSRPSSGSGSGSSSMQISMAQSMGIQQAAAPHLSTHHSSNILLGSENNQAANNIISTAAGGGGGNHNSISNNSSNNSNSLLPAINTDMSDFFSQLESVTGGSGIGGGGGGVHDGAAVLTINSFTSAASDGSNGAGSGSDMKANRFHPYESRASQVFPASSSNSGLAGPTHSMMGHASAAPSLHSYIHYNGNFNDGLMYHNSNDYLGFGGGCSTTGGGGSGGGVGIGPAGDNPVHDQSGEDIWDMDSNTVRRYNPVPDTVSPGPVPTTPTMYGQQHQQQQQQQQLQQQRQHQQHQQQQLTVEKPSWECSGSLYSQYAPIQGQSKLQQSLPPQPISPGIGGPWIGGALPVKGHTTNTAAVESKRPKSYQCEACDKWFTSSGHLKRHFNTTLHKNAIKQKGDGYMDSLSGATTTFSIPSVESRGDAASPCMSLGEESSQSSVCDELSSQSTSCSQSLGGGQLCLTPASTPGPATAVTSIISLNPATSIPRSCSPNSTTSSNVPNVCVSPSQQQMLSPPPEVGASSPLSGLTQLVGAGVGPGSVPPLTPQPPSNSPLTPGSGVSLSPNNGGNIAGSPAHKNRFSPFRSSGPTVNSISYKVQSLDQRSYPSYPATFHALSVPAVSQMTAQNSYNNGEVYMSAQSCYRSDGYNNTSVPHGTTPTSSSKSSSSGSSANTNNASLVIGSGASGGGTGGGGYTGQYQTHYQPILYNTTYDMSSPNYLNHSAAYTDISGYVSLSAGDSVGGGGGSNNGAGFTDSVRSLKLDERDSPEGSEGSEASIKTDSGEFRCNECNKIFNKMCYLKQHNKSFHNGEKPFKCSQCGKRFPVEVLYQEHLAKHAGDKPYKCEVCPKQFNHKTDLRRHMCLHTGEKPFSCDVCGKGFIREDRMVKHADTHKKKAAHVAGGIM